MADLLRRLFNFQIKSHWSIIDQMDFHIRCKMPVCTFLNWDLA